MSWKSKRAGGKIASGSLLLIFAAMAHAGPLRGTVVEKRTGYGLAGATVTIQPSLGLEERTIRTNESGRFDLNVAPGSYVIKASRRGFLPAEYGQQRWNSAGTLLVIDDMPVTLQLAMSRYGAITGTVRDGNEVGIPDQDVAAYTDSQPPRYVTRAKADDHGVFRIGGLQPGRYLVRTLGNTDEDRSYLPTFSHQTVRAEEARPLIVYQDEDTGDGDVRAIQGRLFELSGSAAVPARMSVTVTLAGDMGRTISQGPGFRFHALAPGRYELYAEAHDLLPGTRVYGGYAQLMIDRNLTNYPLKMSEVVPSVFVVEGGAGGMSMKGRIRRKDLAGVGESVSFTLPNMGVPISPGRWEFMAIAPDSYYISRFEGNKRPDGWNEIVALANAYNDFSMGVSGGPGGIRGLVKSGGAVAGGAPVFLEGWDPVTRKRLIELRETRGDMRGNYSFGSLAPGDYRILATYEYSSPDPEAFDVGGAQAIHIEAGSNPQLDLELYGTP